MHDDFELEIWTCGFCNRKSWFYRNEENVPVATLTGEHECPICYHTDLVSET